MSADPSKSAPEALFGDYDALLARMRAKLPGTSAAHERWQLPEPTLLVEGRQTVFQNFDEVCKVLDRDPAYVYKFLLGELGTAGSREAGRLTFKSRVAERQIVEKLEAFVEMFVICQECRRPDTKLVKEGRTTILQCSACGAHRPVRAYAAIKGPEIPAIEEGKEYEVNIVDVGNRGDGLAKVDRFVVFVPGTSKGQKVKVLIERVSGNRAFAKIVR